MSTEFFNDQWRMPSNENQNKVSNYSLQGTNPISISSPAPVGITSSFSFWFKRENTALNAQIYNVVGTGAYGFYIVGTSIIYIRYGAGYIGVNNTETQNALALTDWVHWVITRQEVTSTTQDIRLYANGTLIYSLNGTSSLGTLDSKVNYLMWVLNTSDFLNSFSIFNYALSQSQVTTLYGGGTAVTNPMALSPKPVAYYQLGDQSAYNGANYLVPNNSLQDYVFYFNSSFIDTGSVNLGINASVAMWFNQEVGSVNDYVLLGEGSQGFDYVIRRQSGAFYVWIGGTFYNFSLGNNIVVGDWNFLVVTKSAGDVNVYLINSNGEFSGSHTSAGWTSASFKFDRIGSRTISPINLPFKGLVSNVSTFTTAFTQSQVTTLYNNGIPSDISSLSPVAWWKLNAEDVFTYPNWIIRDSAGTNNGASSGMTSANLVQSTLQLGAGFSPYAFDLDGISQYFNCGTQLGNALGSSVTNFTLSGWYTAQGSASGEGIFGLGNGSSDNFSLVQENYASRRVYFSPLISSAFTYDSRNQWANFVIVVSGDGSSPLTVKYYHDGVEIPISSSAGTMPNSMNFSSNKAYIGNNYNLTRFYNGGISNFSFFDISLTSSQVTELNNNQRTADLNNLSFKKPLAWWELGSNSSFNSSTWTSLNTGTVFGGDAISTANMANDDIINGVGYTGNGLGTSTMDIIGDAPYSTANGLSENMDVLDRVIDVPALVTVTVDFLVIAGGGGGGADNGSGWGGGGGAGGYRNSYNNETSGGNSTSETALSVPASNNVTVTVGEGGSGLSSSTGTGEDSVFYTITSISGGGGGQPSPQQGQNGGSGGGGGNNGPGGSGTSNQGLDGSDGDGSTSGGGGGASQAGIRPDGGDGLSSSITGTAVTRAGGGGGTNYSGSYPSGNGGAGGGGTGGRTSATRPAATNTGSGGGGGIPTGQSGGDGGRGIVILRYPSSSTITVGAGLTASTSTIGGDKVTIFTAGSDTISIA